MSTNLNTRTLYSKVSHFVDVTKSAVRQPGSPSNFRKRDEDENFEVKTWKHKMPALTLEL